MRKKKTTKKLKIVTTVKRPIYTNEDGADFFGDTSEIVPGSDWDYPGSPYTSNDENYDD